MECIFPCERERSEPCRVDMDEINYIYDHIADDESKRVYSKRLLYSLTLDDKYMVEMIAGLPEMVEMGKQIDRPAYIYGAGRRGQRLIELFPDKKWNGYIDREHRSDVGAYHVIPFEDMNSDIIGTDLVVVSNREGYKDIYDGLIKLGVPGSNVVVLSDYVKAFSENIYFDRSCFGSHPRCEGTFLDIGSYDGKDSMNAMRFFEDDRLDIIAFEPDTVNYEKCREALDAFSNIKLLRKGVSSVSGVSGFFENGGASAIRDDGDKKIEITTIDELMRKKGVGYMKLDIEGEEEGAIEGARETIRRDRPRIAVSVYHKRTDIWKLPMLVLQYNPDYRLYFRHHTFSWSDTVMYAM